MVNGPQPVNVIEALLKLTLEPASIQRLDARLAASECIKAFFANHKGIRMHVLRRAIGGHLSGQDEIPNIMSVLLAPESRGNADPYQTWMASVLMFHLVFEDIEAKAMAMKVTEGDAESGEEVITSVQTIVGHLVTGMQRGDDERISVGYLMLLCGWLFEDPDVVNDLLGEGSSIQSFLQETKHPKHRGGPNALLSGLCTILLGIIYEFSSQDSPISRHTLHKLLIEQMGRDQYVDKITKFRESPLVRDFEVLPQTVGANHDGGLPDIFFDRKFIEFLKDNFSRLVRAIDREPGLEISVITNGVQRGISRELVDSLRAELEDRNQALQKLEFDLLSLRQKLEHEQFESKKTTDTNSLETARIKQINEALQRNHEQELQKLDGQHNHAKDELLRQHGEQLRSLDNRLRQSYADHERKSQQARQHHEAQLADFQKTIRSMETDLAGVREQQTGEVTGLQETIQSLESELYQTQEYHAGELADLRGVIQKLESDASKIKEQHAAEAFDLNKTIQDLQSSMDAVRTQHEKEVVDHKATIEVLQSDLGKAKEQATNDIQAVQKEYSAKLSELEKRAEEAERKTESAETNAKNRTEELEKRAQEAERKAEAGEVNAGKNSEELEKRAQEAERKAEAAEANANNDSEELRKRAEEAESKSKQAEADAKKNTDELQDLRTQLDKAKSETKEKEEACESAQSALDKAKSEAKEKEEARQATQTELDDLLIVFGDLEAKRTQDKVSFYILACGFFFFFFFLQVG